MPAPKESLYPADWLKKAEEDFKRVPARIEEGDIEDAAFHLQQGIEKALKGFLLSKGWKLKRIHDLEALLDDAVKYESSLERFREILQYVTGYYLIDRYPAFEVHPSREEVAKAYQQAKPILSLVRREIEAKRA